MVCVNNFHSESQPILQFVIISRMSMQLSGKSRLVYQMKVSFYILLPHRSVKWIAFHCTFLLYFRGTFMKPVSETFFCSFFFRTFAHEFLYKTLIIFLTSTSGFYTKKTFVICIQNSILLNLCFLDACSNDILCGLIFILSTFHILYQHSRFMSIS